MKKGIIIGVVSAIIISIICFLGIKKDDVVNSADSIHPASAETGEISEKIIGNPDTATVVIYEYADFGCSHCAEWNKIINSLIDKYNEKIALVFRSYDLGFQNGSAAAQAATAAQIQGYFKEYKDLLFNNQSEWLYEEDEVDELFTEYFIKATNGAGNVDKFREDMHSDAVKTRLDFENKMGKKINLRGTPLFRIGGEKIDLNRLVETIENIIS